MGSSSSHFPVEVFPSEITLTVSRARLFDVCHTLISMDCQISAITPECCTQHYIWVVDPGARIANMASVGMLGEDVQPMTRNVSKGKTKILHSKRHTTFLEAQLWHKELASSGYEVLAISPPNQLGCKYAFVQS